MLHSDARATGKNAARSNGPQYRTSMKNVIGSRCKPNAPPRNAIPNVNNGVPTAASTNAFGPLGPRWLYPDGTR